MSCDADIDTGAIPGADLLGQAIDRLHTHLVETGVLGRPVQACQDRLNKLKAKNEKKETKKQKDAESESAKLKEKKGEPETFESTTSALTVYSGNSDRSSSGKNNRRSTSSSNDKP